MKDEQSGAIFISTVPFPHLSEYYQDTDWSKAWKKSKPPHGNLDNRGYVRKAGVTWQGKPTRGIARWIYDGK